MTTRRPSKCDFTKKEWAIVQRCDTPYRVQKWLYSLPYNAEQTGESLKGFRGVVTSGKAHCLEAALAAATILEQYGYPVQLLDLESQDQLDHVLFLYRQDGKWGTVGKSRDPGLHGRRPHFSSVKDVVASYRDPFVDYGGRIIGYGVGQLDDVERCDWRFSKRNVWKVQQYLIDMPHAKFRMTDARYAYYYQRYCAFRKRFPERKPTYYEGRASWIPGYPKGC